LLKNEKPMNTDKEPTCTLSHFYTQQSGFKKK